MEGLAGILYVEFLSNGAGKGRGGTAHGDTGTGEAAAIAHAAATWRAELDELALSSTQARPALIAAARAIGHLLEDGVIIIDYVRPVLHVIQAWVYTQAATRHPHHLWVIPFYAILSDKYVLARFTLRSDILGVVAARAHAEHGTARRSIATHAAPRLGLAWTKTAQDAYLVISLPT